MTSTSECDFDEVWDRIVRAAGTDFVLKQGAPFTYSVSGNSLVTSRTQYPLSRNTFEQAWQRMPLVGPGEIHDLRGPSYVWAVLNDSRIRD